MKKVIIYTFLITLMTSCISETRVYQGTKVEFLSSKPIDTIAKDIFVVPTYKLEVMDDFQVKHVMYPVIIHKDLYVQWMDFPGTREITSPLLTQNDFFVPLKEGGPEYLLAEIVSEPLKTEISFRGSEKRTTGFLSFNAIYYYETVISGTSKIRVRDTVELKTRENVNLGNLVVFSPENNFNSNYQTQGTKIAYLVNN